MNTTEHFSRSADEAFLCLSRRLQDPLPGRKAHDRAWPADLPNRDIPEDTPYREAAVLLALVADETGFWIPFVERSQTMPHHPGQIGFPGGGKNKGETAEECALREAEEEVGLPPIGVEILGQLSPVTIGVSRFRIEVLVGAVRGKPDLTPEDREVTRILRGDPGVWRDGPTAEFVRQREAGTFRAPAYALEDTLIWGATALILAEFLWIWDECGPFELRDRSATQSRED